MTNRTRYSLLVFLRAGFIFSCSLPVLGQPPGSGKIQKLPAKVPEAPKIEFVGSYRVGADKVDPSNLPIIGTWRINFDRSDLAIKLQGRFKETGTTIYTTLNGGIKTETFLFYPPNDDNYKKVFTDDAREYWFKLDGKNIYKNPQGPNGLGQTVGMWLVDRNTIYRERMTKGLIDERVLYRVSPDGKTLVWTTFSDAGDSGHFVWDKIELPRP